MAPRRPNVFSKTALRWFVAGGILGGLVPAALLAGSVGALRVFSNATVADADQVNENNAAIAAAVNDNDARLGTIEANHLPKSGGALTGSLTDVDDTLSFRPNPAGGVGDTAAIRFAGYGTGEGTELSLLVGGTDADDRIRLSAPGGVVAGCRSGFTTVADGRLCVENTLRGPATIHVAIATCQGLTAGGTVLGGRVCTHNDMQQACGVGMNPYGATFGWYGDHGQVTGGNTDDEFLTWNRDHCTTNNDGPPQEYTSSLNYRCCY